MDEDRRKETTLRAASPETREPGRATEIARLFEEHHDDVFRAAYRVTGSAADAEDVLQTVFLRLLRRTGSPAGSGFGASYLRRAAINAGLDVIRRKKVRATASLSAVEWAADPGPGPDARQREREIRHHVRESLASMNPRAAEIFALRYFEGYGNREIAGMLGTSWSTIAVTLHRARGRIRRRLSAILGGGNHETQE